MPYSTSEERSTVQNQEDDVLPDAPVNDQDTDDHNDTESSSSQDPHVFPSDIVKVPTKVEMKIEDLFHTDDEDDEEFPSSAPANEDIPSSPPVAPG